MVLVVAWVACSLEVGATLHSAPDRLRILKNNIRETAEAPVFACGTEFLPFPCSFFASLTRRAAETMERRVEVRGRINEGKSRDVFGLIRVCCS